jgi:hypothetical protein
MHIGLRMAVPGLCDRKEVNQMYVRHSLLPLSVAKKCSVTYRRSAAEIGRLLRLCADMSSLNTLKPLLAHPHIYTQ